MNPSSWIWSPWSSLQSWIRPVFAHVPLPKHHVCKAEYARCSLMHLFQSRKFASSSLSIYPHLLLNALVSEPTAICFIPVCYNRASTIRISFTQHSCLLKAGHVNCNVMRRLQCLRWKRWKRWTRWKRCNVRIEWWRCELWKSDV